MLSNEDGGLVASISAARKLFRRYAEANSGFIFEPMLERCLNLALKMEMPVTARRF